MTDQHPLTDEICLAIDDNSMIDEDDWKGCMRAGADWQLEQVIEWLEDNLDERYVWADVMPPGIDVEDLIVDIKLAMRPTQEDNS